MCTFVTLIARSDNVDRVNAVLGQRDTRDSRRRAEVVRTPCLQRLLKRGEHEFWMIKPPCDCGTLLGSKLLSGPSPEERLRSTERKYRHKGWSPAKIARALAEQERASSRRHGDRHTNEDAGYWIDLVSNVAADLSLASVGLMHRFYVKSDLEEFHAARRNAGPIWSAADMLTQMEDGVIYDFKCDA